MTQLLSVGDLIEAGALFGGITQENVLLQVMSEEDDTVVFEASIFGVHLGDLVVKVDANGDIISGDFNGNPA